MVADEEEKAERIEQNVAVSGHARDIIQIGKIVLQIVRHPPVWQEAIWRLLSKIWGFLSENVSFLLVVIVLEMALTVVFLRYRNLYLIPLWRWSLAAALLMTAAWGWYVRFWPGRTQIRPILTLLVTLSLAVLLGWEIWQAAFPKRFDSQIFGIAFAELGEGPDYKRTKQTREISNQVYEFLAEVVRKEFVNRTDAHLRGTVTTTFEPRPVELMRIGVIPDSQTADAYGKRIRSDVVIWGQILVSEPRGITIRFYVLETLDRAINPDFPFVLPVTATSTDIFADFREIDLERNPASVKRIVSDQSITMSSFILGLIAYLERDFPTATRQLELAIQKTEDNPSLRISEKGLALLCYYLGKSYHFLGQVETGQEWLLRAKDLNPDEPAIPLSLAFGYRSLGLQQESDEYLALALDSIDAWLDTHPGDTVALYDRGIVSYMRDEPETELLDYEAILERDPNFYTVYINSGRAYAKLGRLGEAESVLMQAVELAKKNGTNSSAAYLELAKVRTQANQPEAARVAYLEAIRRAPDVALNYYYYARFLEAEQENDAALLAYQDMLETTEDHNRWWAYAEMGRFQKQLGLLEQASASYQRAVHEQPTDALLRAFLAEIFYELGDVDQANHQFEQAVALNDDSYYVFSSYARVLFLEGEYEQAAQKYEQSLELRPIAEEELQYLAITYIILGQCQKAYETYSQMLNLRDHFSEATIRNAQEQLKDPDFCVESR